MPAAANPGDDLQRRSDGIHSKPDVTDRTQRHRRAPGVGPDRLGFQEVSEERSAPGLGIQAGDSRIEPPIHGAVLTGDLGGERFQAFDAVGTPGPRTEPSQFAIGQRASRRDPTLLRLDEFRNRESRRLQR